MKLTKKLHQDNASPRHRAHLERVADLHLARKAGVSTKLARALRLSAHYDDVGFLNALQVDKNGEHTGKYQFKIEGLWRIEKAVGDAPKYEAYLQILQAAVAQRANDNHGRSDLRGPVDQEDVRKRAFAQNDGFFHRLGSKLSKESSASRLVNGLARAGLGIGEGMRRGGKGIRNAFSSSNVRHGQEYIQATNYVAQLQRAAQAPGRSEPEMRILARKRDLSKRLRTDTDPAQRRRIIKELLYQEPDVPTIPDQPREQAQRLQRTVSEQPLNFTNNAITGGMTRKRARYANASQELSLAAQAGVSRPFVRVLRDVFVRSTEDVAAALNEYSKHDGGKFVFKVEQLWRMQGYLASRNPNDPSVQLLSGAIDRALEIRTRWTGSESARGISGDSLKAYFLNLDGLYARLGKVGKETRSLATTHHAKAALLGFGEYTRRGIKAPRNWLSGGQTARHLGQLGYVHDVLDARWKAAGASAEKRESISAMFEAIGTKTNQNRQVVRDLYHAYSNQKRVLKNDQADIAQQTAHSNSIKNAFVDALHRPSIAINDLQANREAQEQEQTAWTLPQRQAIAAEALGYLLTSTPNDSDVPALRPDASVREPGNEVFTRAAVPTLQAGLSLKDLQNFMGHDGTRPFDGADAIEILRSTMHGQLNLEGFSPNAAQLAAFNALEVMDLRLTSDGGLIYPRTWSVTQRGELHIPGIGTRTRDGRIAVNGRVYNVPPQGIALGDGWYLARGGAIVTPEGLQYNRGQLYDTQGNPGGPDGQAWQDTWNQYMNDLEEAAPPAMLLDVADVLSDLAARHPRDLDGLMGVAQDMFSGDSQPAVKAFLTAHRSLMAAESAAHDDQPFYAPPVVPQHAAVDADLMPKPLNIRNASRHTADRSQPSGSAAPNPELANSRGSHLMPPPMQEELRSSSIYSRQENDDALNDG